MAHALTSDRIAGVICALALGDATGAPHEGGPLERALWRLIGIKDGKQRWTDDTQMSLDTLESLLEKGCIDQDDLAWRYAASYRWSRGYGPGAAKVLRRIRRGMSWQQASRSVYAEGSFGNGGAMRAPVVGVFFAALGTDAVIAAVQACAEVTHGHALAKEGAALVALCTALSLQDLDHQTVLQTLQGSAKSTIYRDKLSLAANWLGNGENILPQQVAKQLGNGIAASASCVSAIYLGRAFAMQSFEALMRFVIAMGGDVDTIAAMAAAIWGAQRGKSQLPQGAWLALEHGEIIEQLSAQLAGRCLSESRSVPT